MRVTMKAIYDFAAALKEQGPMVEAEFFEGFQSHPVGDFHTFAGFDEIKQWEEAYLDPAELVKYADSVGHQPGDND